MRKIEKKKRKNRKTGERAGENTINKLQHTLFSPPSLRTNNK